MSKIKTFLIVSSIFISFFNLNSSLADEQKSNEYIGLSLEELMEEEVFSHSKREEKAFTVESALFVVTNEDIKRAGVESIPEALRLVPGVQVSRINSSIWSISIRGFSNQFANKLLVLIDGKSVYTPLFSGVYWNDQDLILDDVERIEVIRGPGGTIWGANAVNGVINIITKNSNQTQGNQLSA
ncbi:MAG: TonB-dependent receptor, partial [Proteobacteria bacterium]|nr:TonB-dependent receptor [Pseudomonadota bacterium]